MRARWPNWWRTCGPSTSTPRTSPYRGAADGGDRRKIDLEVTDLDGEVHIVSIDRGEVDFSDFRIGESVQMAVTMRLISKPGGGESRRYTATMIERGGHVKSKPLL